jgi:Asp/Glu/hydantoin racemase
MYEAQAGRASYGHSIGILMQNDGLPRLPGDVGNLTTYPFPVTIRVIDDYPLEHLEELELQRHAASFVRAAKELEQLGVKAITGGCGFLALLQPDIAAAVGIPVFMSSLIQVPLVRSMLRDDQKVGIITADSRKLTEQHVRAVGWSMTEIPVAVIGVEDEAEAFDRSQLVGHGFAPEVIARIESAMVRTARRLVERESKVGAIVLECTNMPPFADAIQRTVNLPVFDVVTLIGMVHASLTRQCYRGHY